MLDLHYIFYTPKLLSLYSKSTNKISSKNFKGKQSEAVIQGCRICNDNPAYRRFISALLVSVLFRAILNPFYILKCFFFTLQRGLK